jgi:hypothetical protein
MRWRRGGDSNPRDPFGSTRFPSARTRPLCDLSSSNTVQNLSLCRNRFTGNNAVSYFFPHPEQHRSLLRKAMLIAKAINARDAPLPPKIMPRSVISVLTTPIIAASDVRSRRKTTTPRRTAQGSIELTLFFLRIGIVEVRVQRDVCSEQLAYLKSSTGYILRDKGKYPILPMHENFPALAIGVHHISGERS